MRVDKPTALVTGASSGIGRAAAAALVEAGFEVVGTSRDASTVSPLEGVMFVDLDVTDDASVANAVDGVIDRFGRLDVLVNNAGVGAAGAAEESSAELARRVFDINVFGVVRMTNAVLPHLRERGAGRIVNVSSIVGFLPMPFMALYAASKHALEGYSVSVDHEVREHGVRVVLVEPAWTSTSFDSNTLQADHPIAVYAERREGFEEYMAGAVRDGDAPESVAASVVLAATDRHPRLRYAARQTSVVRLMQRLVPERLFDRQLRKLSRLPA